MASSLPEDILLEILFRLKDVPAALFRCATACTRWRGLVADPGFLRRCWPDQDVSSSIVGFFTRQLSWPDVPTPCFTPTPRSTLVPRLRSLRSFMPAAPAGVFDRAVALISRHGLLLVRLNSIATRGYPNPIVLDLAVCNLLTGTCHMLPTLMFGSVFDECEWNGYAILTGADCRSNDAPPVLPSSSSFFNVAIISSNKSSNGTKHTLHMLSSEEGRWMVPTDCFHGIVLPPSKHGSSSQAVVRRGTAHWLICHYDELSFSVLNLNMRTGHFSSTKIPLGRNYYLNGHPFLTLAINGALSLRYMQQIDTKLVEIWEQQEEQPNKDGGSEWVCARTIELKQLGKRVNEVGELCILGHRCGTLLIHDSYHGMYTADLETGMMEEVADWRMVCIIPSEIVPFEVDWPMIFASRLDTRKQKMENQVTYPPGWELMYLRGKKRRKTSDVSTWV